MVTTRRQLQRETSTRRNFAYDPISVRDVETDKHILEWRNILTIGVIFYFVLFMNDISSQKPQRQFQPMTTSIPVLKPTTKQFLMPPANSVVSTNITGTNYTQIATIIVSTNGHGLYKKAIEENSESLLLKLNLERPDYYKWTSEIANITTQTGVFHVNEYVNIGGLTMVPSFMRIIKPNVGISHKFIVDVYRNTSWVKETSLFVI